MTVKITFRTSDETNKMIRNLAESKYKDDEGKLTKAMNFIINKFFNRFQILADECPARTFIDDHYECTWGRMGKTPDTKKIGISDEAMNNRCEACRLTIDMKERLITLEQQLARGKVIMIPSCRKGAKLNEDMTELLCPEIGAWRPIKDRKKKTDPQPCHYRGSKPYKRCEFIEWTQTVIKGKLPDGQNL